jgi:hypothetical protein
MYVLYMSLYAYASQDVQGNTEQLAASSQEPGASSSPGPGLTFGACASLYLGHGTWKDSSSNNHYYSLAA